MATESRRESTASGATAVSGATAAAGRTGVVGELLVAEVAARAASGPVTVLDCGGGSGAFAVPLAQAGAEVTVIDISVDALATLARRAAENGVADRVRPVQGDLDALPELLGGTPAADIVLAHGILESLDDAAAAFGAMAGALRPGGQLSVLVSNPAAAVLSRALAGEIVAALREVQEYPAREARFGPSSVRGLCAEHGLLVERVQGVGVFAEWVPGAALDAPGAREALRELEAATARVSPFAEIAARQHLLARKPG